MDGENPTLGKEFGQAIAGFTPKTIKDLVFEQIKSAIITGQLKPGQRLVEHRLASMLNVSRTPLREALRLLEQELLVERLPQGGVQVTLISIDEMERLNDVRCILEVYCAEKAAHNVASGKLDRASQQDLDALRSLPDQMYSKLNDNDIMGLLALGAQFHEAIHSLADNPISSDYLRQVIGAMARYRALVPPTRTATTVQEHVRIAQAVTAGNPALAGELMKVHVTNAGEHYSTTIQELQKKGETI